MGDQRKSIPEKALADRLIIENVRPSVDGGLFPAKRAEGELVEVSADIFTDGHGLLRARVLYRQKGRKEFGCAEMTHAGNDLWRGVFPVESRRGYIFTVEGWLDRFGTWRSDILKKAASGQVVKADRAEGAELIRTAAARAPESASSKLKAFAKSLVSLKTPEALQSLAEDVVLGDLMDTYEEKASLKRYERELPVEVERRKALFSAWYEFFPRSFPSKRGGHGTLRSSERMLPYIAGMGFDVVYLPPVHPIGRTARKGRNNAHLAREGDVGSPWAIGSAEGGHKSVDPALGTLEDFERFMKEAARLGLEVAMDLAFQCSRDHPYLKEHPEWFKWRSDGSIQFAENPPKKYEDIVPFSFETSDREGLWEELKSIVFFWMDRGVRIFRVDNPHTKPFAFWEWLIAGSRAKDPDVLFLSEAFTRPKIMKRLAKVGFSQSYTYFTWRETKHEFIEYMSELTDSPVRDFMRPNFWPNTPDILPWHLQHGGRPAFILRLVLAATLSSNYGIYGPAFELCEANALPGREEYLDSEKYELKEWDLTRRGNIRRVVTSVNRIRRANPALQDTFNLRFCPVGNDQLMCYVKMTPDRENVIFVAANMDPYHRQSGWVELPLEELGLDEGTPFIAHDLISEDRFLWRGRYNYIELDPHIMPVHLMRLGAEGSA